MARNAVDCGEANSWQRDRNCQPAQAVRSVISDRRICRTLGHNLLVVANLGLVGAFDPVSFGNGGGGFTCDLKCVAQ